MSMTTLVTPTPHYILREENRRIGPKVVQLDSGMECFPIYGFSGKESYDRFCLNSPLALSPYPLVKGYLRNQASEPDQGLKLVVVDAVGPREPNLQAATMRAVLDAQEKRNPQVTAAYRLEFDPEVEAYRVIISATPG